MIEGDPNPGLRSGALHAIYDLIWLLVAVLGAPLWIFRVLTRPSFARYVRERTGPAGWGGANGLDSAPRILIHGVSVGEVKGAQSLVATLKRERPDAEIVVSTTTDTGTEMARALFGAKAVVRFPLDVSWLSKRFFESVRPTAVVLIELEVWPNFLRCANRLGIPIAVINGRITENSFGRYQLFKKLFPQFNRISLLCVQSEVYADRFRALGVEPRRLVVTGNVKADGLEIGKRQVGPDLPRWVGVQEGQIVVVAGSTHEPEERWIAEAWRKGVPESRLVLVPRHPVRAPEVERSLADLGVACQRLTELRAGSIALDVSKPLLVDTIGELERVYACSDLVVMGGSFIPHGGQNLLEAAAQGLPIICGPYMENFTQEVTLLEEAGACLRAKSHGALAGLLADLQADPDRRRAVGTAGLAATDRQRGATVETWRALAPLCFGSQGELPGSGHGSVPGPEGA